MGLESEIERLFHEAQDWDMEMVANSALPTYHSNYPSSPPPAGYQNASIRWVPSSTSPKGKFQLSVDKNYYQAEALVLYPVDDDEIMDIGKRRLASLRKLHDKEYKEHLDEVSAEVLNVKPRRPRHGTADHSPQHVHGGPLEHALDHLKSEGPVLPISIKLYEGDAPKAAAAAAGDSNTTKVVITFQECDYVLYQRRFEVDDLVGSGNLKVPVAGFADRWPRQIMVLGRDGRAERLYLRADLCVPRETEDSIKRRDFPEKLRKLVEPADVKGT